MANIIFAEQENARLDAPSQIMRQRLKSAPEKLLKSPMTAKMITTPRPSCRRAFGMVNKKISTPLVNPQEKKLLKPQETKVMPAPLRREEYPEIEQFIPYDPSGQGSLRTRVWNHRLKGRLKKGSVMVETIIGSFIQELEHEFERFCVPEVLAPLNCLAGLAYFPYDLPNLGEDKLEDLPVPSPLKIPRCSDNFPELSAFLQTLEEIPDLPSESEF